MKYNDIIFQKFSYLLSEGKLKTQYYKAKDVIFKENEECNYLSFIMDGEVEISTLSYNGNQEVISIIKEKEFFGQYILFQDKGIYLGDVTAKKPTSIVNITKDELLDYFVNDKVFLEAYIALISKESFNIKQQVKLLSHKNVIDRLIFYIENNQINNICCIDSVSSLAKKINLPRETVSRALSKLEKDKFIKRDNNKIKLIKNL